MIATHKIDSIKFDNDFIYLKIDGNEIKVALDNISLKLMKADEHQRMFYKISPSGYGIHWPLIDEDLSVDGILRLQ
ncbi:MAG: DUF2442 domain-containing protein [Bacteroidota bacterium]|jgi:hypothetical protein